MEVIAAATDEDIPGLCDLLSLLFAQEADFTPNRALQEAGLREIINSASVGRVFVARSRQRVEGMVSLLYSVSTAQGGRVCLLEDMIVHPDRRGNGLGSRLLQHAIDFARAQGCTRISLLTDRSNDAARRFYARAGFTESAMTAMRLYL